MKLYFSRGACSLGPRIIINELGLQCEYEAVDLKTKKTAAGKDFLEINPKGAVPTLITDKNETITEAGVILQYLAYVGKNTELLPPESNFAHFRVLEALNFVASDMHKGVGVLFNQKITPEMRKEIFIPMIQTKLAYLNQRLTQTKFVALDNFTLPDAYLFVILTWVAHFHLGLETYPTLLNYFHELKQRPSIVKSMQEEGLIAAKV